MEGRGEEGGKVADVPWMLLNDGLAHWGKKRLDGINGSVILLLLYFLILKISSTLWRCRALGCATRAYATVCRTGEGEERGGEKK